MSEEVAFGKWLTELRRHFHKYPELGYQEIKTSQKIREILTELGVPFIYPVAETGVVAFLKARSDGPVRAFRTDMDALPIEEQNNVSYRSRHQGIMHACGHDGHMAIALGIVRKLVELKWTEKGRGKILFIFQPAEEGGAGAARMLESGALEDENVEAIYAFHLNPGLDLGKVGVAKDVSNAASDMFEIKVVGTGGHGAHPHVATDVILTTADVITKTHHIVSRSINALDSAVVSVGSVHAGSAPNVLPSEAVIAGTIRTFREEVRKHIQDTMKEICSGIAAYSRCDIKVSFTPGYPPVVNDGKLVKRVKKIAGSVLGRNKVQTEAPRMGSEDFAYFAQKWPGVFIYLGCAFLDEPIKRLLHSPLFDFDERALEIGVRLGTELLLSHD